MTTCRDVIAYAMRLGRVLPAGEDPENDEAADGLIALQSLYDSWVSGGMFGRLEDVTLTANDNVEEGKRYYVPTGFTLTENPTIAAEDSADGVERQPRDLAIYESLTEAGTRTVKVYDRTSWVALTGLALGDNAPLAGRSPMGLAAALACSGAFLAIFGDADVSPRVERLANSFLIQLSYKLGSTRDRVAAEYF